MRPDIEGIRTRTEATTWGPWKWRDNQEGHPREGEILLDSIAGNVLSGWGSDLADGICVSDNDKEFIAAARTDIPDLLAYVAALEKRLALVDAEGGEK